LGRASSILDRTETQWGVGDELTKGEWIGGLEDVRLPSVEGFVEKEGRQTLLQRT
jgi:hypothetical protein